MKEESSKVDHPAHYNVGKIECIDAIDEAIKAVYGKDDVFKKIYKYRENYSKVLSQLNQIFSPRINLIE